MKFERVFPGEYRAQLRGSEYIWVFRAGRKWYWVPGGYSGHPGIIGCVGPFTSKKKAIRDVISSFTF